MAHSKGNWTPGKPYGTVVTDDPTDFNTESGHKDEEYYGGILIAESIAKPDDIKFIAAGPAMYKALEEIAAGPQGETKAEYIFRVKQIANAAIKKAE